MRISFRSLWIYIFLASLWVMAPSAVFGAAVDQWASTLVTFSTESSSNRASAALGEPDVFNYGGNSHSWTPFSKCSTHETITLGFGAAVYASGVTIREVQGNGFVEKIELLGADGRFQTVWQDTDPSLPGSVVDFEATWPTTGFKTKTVRISIYTKPCTQDDTYEAIDAVRLHGFDVNPDLIVQKISGPGSAKRGKAIEVSAVVVNRNLAAAGAFKLGFYLSTDKTINSAKDIFIGGIRLPGIGMGESSASTLILRIPESVAAGSYYLGAIADFENSVGESNEKNNTLATGTKMKISP